MLTRHARARKPESIATKSVAPEGLRRVSPLPKPCALPDDDVPAKHYLRRLQREVMDSYIHVISTLQALEAAAWTRRGTTLNVDDDHDLYEELGVLSGDVEFCRTTLMGALALVRLGLASFLADRDILESYEWDNLIAVNNKVDELCFAAESLEEELASSTSCWDSAQTTVLFHHPWLTRLG